MSLEEKISKLRKEVTEQSAEYRFFSREKDKNQAEVLRLKEEAALLTEVAAILSSIGEEEQTTLQTQIEGLVTEGLQSVFEENYSFYLIQSVKANAPQVEFVVRTTFADGSFLDTAPKVRGGGVNQVIGILLRVIVKLLNHDKKQMFLPLDEATSMISAQYLPRFCEFLQQLVEKTPLQVVLVTHQDIWTDYADIVYRLDLDRNGYTQVKREV